MTTNLRQLSKLYPWPAKAPCVKQWTALESDDARNIDLFPLFFHEDAALILEVGSDLGIFTQSLLRQAPHATVICLDHWNGRTVASRSNPERYETFLKNLWNERSRVLPFRSKTRDGLEMMRGYGISPEAVYLNDSMESVEILNEIEQILSVFPNMTLYGNSEFLSEILNSLKRIAECHQKKLITESRNGFYMGSGFDDRTET